MPLVDTFELTFHRLKGLTVPEVFHGPFVLSDQKSVVSTIVNAWHAQHKEKEKPIPYLLTADLVVVVIRFDSSLNITEQPDNMLAISLDGHTVKNMPTDSERCHVYDKQYQALLLYDERGELNLRVDKDPDNPDKRQLTFIITLDRYQSGDTLRTIVKGRLKIITGELQKPCRSRYHRSNF